MSVDRQFVDLLRTAFPRDETNVPRCNWCGGTRPRSNAALCGNCWFSVSAADRRRYMTLSLEDRAKWILANRPWVKS